MVGNRGGVCCLFQPEIPQLIGMHWTTHKLELAAISGTEKPIRITALVYGMFKQYHYCAKASNELKSVNNALDETAVKPSNQMFTTYQECFVQICEEVHTLWCCTMRTWCRRSRNAWTCHEGFAYPVVLQDASLLPSGVEHSCETWKAKSPSPGRCHNFCQTLFSIFITVLDRIATGSCCAFAEIHTGGGGLQIQICRAEHDTDDARDQFQRCKDRILDTAMGQVTTQAHGSAQCSSMWYSVQLKIDPSCT